MPGRADHASHAAAIARISEIAIHARVLKDHLHQVLESPAFRGSRRSQELLRHIVENALEGRFDQLKERIIGVEVFSRPLSYDTGGDSIVRVSASDVRKRLYHYYADTGSDSRFRIELPAGSYIPEFREMVADEAAPARPVPAQMEVFIAEPQTFHSRIQAVAPGRNWVLYGLLAITISAVALAGYFWVQNRSLRSSAKTDKPDVNVMPWPALFDKKHRANVIVSDAGFAAIQDLLGIQIPLSDYTSLNYPPKDVKSDSMRAATFLAKRHFTAAVDAVIATKISELSESSGSQIQVRAARSLNIQDFKNDDSFVLLGSMRANPWVVLFDDQADFTMEYSPVMKKPICLNKRPKRGEAGEYVPTIAFFGQTGVSYAILAFVANPNQSGNALLIEGTSAEGTEIAGKLVTNPERFAQVLRQGGLDPTGPARHFQILLRVSMMAGSPSGFEVAAFHSGDVVMR